MRHPIAAEVIPYRIPLNRTLQLGDQQISMREGYYLTLTFDDGTTGSGEIAPLPGFSRETLQQAHQALSQWIGAPSIRVTMPSVAWGIACAMQPPPRPLKSQPDYPLLMGEFAEIQHLLKQWPKPLTRAKLKVARQPLEQEVNRVQAIQQAWPELKLRLDANQGWTLKQAHRFVTQIDLNRIEYLEQPCTQWQACAELAAISGCPVALDESTQNPQYRFHYFDGLAALVLKPTLIGDHHRLLTFIRAAHQKGVDVSISSSYESRLGLAHLQAFAERYTQSSAGLDTRGIFAAPPELLASNSFSLPNGASLRQPDPQERPS